MSLIEIIKYLILGFVQGVSEVLPISSSGHLLIFSKLLEIDITLNLEIFLHLGSLIALIIYERKEINNLIKGFFSLFSQNKDFKQLNLDNRKYFFMLILATIPLVLVTILIGDKIEILCMDIKIVAICLMINGLFMYILYKKINYPKKSTFDYFDALKIGLFQTMGIFSGISRSGSCLLGGSNIETNTSKRFTFLLFIPVCLGALIYKVLFSDFDLSSISTLQIISFLITIPITYLSLSLLSNVLKSKKKIILLFSLYTFLLGISVYVFL